MKKSNEQSIGDAIRRFLDEHRLHGKLAEAEVVAAWTNVMGPAIDRRTNKIRLEKGGILFVNLNSSVLRQELSMQRSRLVQILNEYIGRELIKEVRLN